MKTVNCGNCNAEVVGSVECVACGYRLVGDSWLAPEDAHAVDRFMGFLAIGILIVGLGFLVTCAGGSDPDEPAPVNTAQQDSLWKIKAEEDVRASLKDGGSAEFRGVYISRREGAPFVCGEVNSKNSFGGYGGFQRFIYAGSLGAVLEEQVEDGGMDEVWRKFC